MRDLLVRLRGSALGRQPRAAIFEDPENPDNWLGINYVHDRVLDQLRTQSQLWEEADGRLRLILGVISVVFAATLGLIPRGSLSVGTAAGTELQPILLPFWSGAFAVWGMLLFGLAGAVALVGYWPRTFTWPPDPNAMRAFVTTDEREIKLIVLDEMVAAYRANELALGRKFLLFGWSIAIAAIATGLLGASVIIELLQVTRAYT